MMHTDFRIGLAFYTTRGTWQCTDVGARVITAIRLDGPHPSWYHEGPPYVVSEVVFDETEQGACTLVSTAAARMATTATVQASKERRFLAREALWGWRNA
jgi:hypothetical protein